MSALEKSVFFDTMAEQGVALTYDDVRLDTRASEVSPYEIDTTTLFSKNIELKTPIVSAAMDTVTTSDMAISIAKLGGIGVVHAGLSIKEQRNEVRRVKLELNGLIEEPIMVEESQTLESVLNTIKKNKFKFHTFPVTDNNKKFVGILTGKDFEYPESMSVSVGEAMTPEHRVKKARPNTSIDKAYKLMQKHKKNTLPLVDKEGVVKGLYVFSDVKRIVRSNSGLYNVDADGRLRVAAALPTGDEAVERLQEMGKYLDVAVIDTAQGDSRFAIATLERLKEEFSDLDIVIGNISTDTSAKKLADAGADGIKIGQGPGSICTTRVETGIGCPQVTAVYECAQEVESLGVPICADGGIKDAGDISIAIAAGAHTVMMGSMLAGTKEAPGEIIELENGSRVKLYRGMGSPSAMRDSAASRQRYSVEGSGEPLAEGVESYVPYKGSVVDMVERYLKALRKSMSYVGAKDIDTHRKETRIRRITNSGIRESHPHDVRVITK